MVLTDFDYELPAHLIAQYPLSGRGGSRLLHVNAAELVDRTFSDIVHHVSPGDVVVLNDTRVIKARLYGEKESGGKVEALIERVLNDQLVLAHIRASKSPKPGTRLVFDQRWLAQMEKRVGELFLLRFLSERNVFDILETSGALPLPPYIERHVQQDDDERYQTVYARQRGAVAAPTAGLHFTQALLDALTAKGVRLAWVTLHVGAGTFQPVRVHTIAEHKMHTEVYEVPPITCHTIEEARREGHKVLAVGTTSLRALEAAAQQGRLRPGRGETDLFITPGYRFNVVDRLLTNFHLPKSTLLILVSAFAGQQVIRRAYQHAVENEYRFFSYGDAMLLERQCAE